MPAITLATSVLQHHVLAIPEPSPTIKMRGSL